MPNVEVHEYNIDLDVRSSIPSLPKISVVRREIHALDKCEEGDLSSAWAKQAVARAREAARQAAETHAQLNDVRVELKATAPARKRYQPSWGGSWPTDRDVGGCRTITAGSTASELSAARSELSLPRPTSLSFPRPTSGGFGASGHDSPNVVLLTSRSTMSTFVQGAAMAGGLGPLTGGTVDAAGSKWRRARARPPVTATTLISKLVPSDLHVLRRKAGLRSRGATPTTEADAEASEDLDYGDGEVIDPAVAMPPTPENASAQSEALSALSNPGYAPGEAASAVAQDAGAFENATTPVLIREALKRLAPKG